MLPPISLSSVKQFLARKGWDSYKITDRFQKLSAPEEIGDSVKLTLPITDTNEYDSALLRKVVEFIAELYEYSREDLLSAFLQNTTIFATQLIDETTTYGNVPFLKYEHHVQELKSLLLNNASFAISKEHYVSNIPEEANTYLSLCNFLQTSKGSFVSKVQLPKAVELSANLFSEYAVQSSSVNNNLGSMLKFVIDDIYKARESDIYTVEHVKANAERININVLESINSLFKRTCVKEINFYLIDTELDLKIESGPVGGEEFKQLENYIDLASAVFSNHVEIDSRGKVVQLRSSDTKGSNNLVVINRLQRGLKPIHVIVDDSRYDLAITAHKTKGSVAIKGTALETKNYLRIVRLVEFSIK